MMQQVVDYVEDRLESRPPNPQQPEIRRSERTAVTNEPAPEATDPESTRKKGHAHGTDKGGRAGG